MQTGNKPIQKIRELASSASAENNPDGATFFWSPKKRDALSCDQLVLPQQCQALILNIAHDLPTAGHLGTNKRG